MSDGRERDQWEMAVSSRRPQKSNRRDVRLGFREARAWNAGGVSSAQGYTLAKHILPRR